MDVNEIIAVAEKCEPPPLPEGIASYEDPQDPAVKGGSWTIETITQADWALQRKGECEAEIAEVDALEAAAITRIRTKCDRLRASARTGVSYFEYQLLTWMGRNRKALLKGRAKSKRLLYGTVGWRATGGRLSVTDKKALAEWVAALPRESPLARWKAEPVMDALQKHCRDTGEIPPGTTWEPERDDPYTKPDDAPETALERT